MKESFIKNKYGILLMLISSMCVCIGQLLWKISLKYGFIAIAIGFIFYGIGALAMLVAYKYGKLSVLQPMLSLNYVLSLILARVILKEKITIIKGIGVIIIIIGVIFIVGGDQE